jgi:hypothetical protein
MSRLPPELLTLSAVFSALLVKSKGSFNDAARAYAANQFSGIGRRSLQQ